MSPRFTAGWKKLACGPRASGDEPFSTEKFMIGSGVVPARAGMSPDLLFGCAGWLRGPRASGDEPKKLWDQLVASTWSPRERG